MTEKGRDMHTERGEREREAGRREKMYQEAFAPVPGCTVGLKPRAWSNARQVY